jgi:hypothetical protein
MSTQVTTDVMWRLLGRASGKEGNLLGPADNLAAARIMQRRGWITLTPCGAGYVARITALGRAELLRCEIFEMAGMAAA